MGVLNKVTGQAPNGLGPEMCLSYLKWFLKPGEGIPDIFKDHVFLRQNEARLFSSEPLDSNVEECGVAHKNCGSVWLHFQAREQDVLLSIWARRPSTAEVWTKSLQDAVRMFENFLVPAGKVVMATGT